MPRTKTALPLEQYRAAREAAPHSKLRELRLARGATIMELADAAQVSPSYVCSLERHPHLGGPAVMGRLAVALGTTPDELRSERAAPAKAQAKAGRR